MAGVLCCANLQPHATMDPMTSNVTPNGLINVDDPSDITRVTINRYTSPVLPRMANVPGYTPPQSWRITWGGTWEHHVPVTALVTATPDGTVYVQPHGDPTGKWLVLAHVGTDDDGQPTVVSNARTRRAIGAVR